MCVLLSCGFNFGPRNNSENVLTGLLKTQTKYNFYPIYHSIFKKSETPSASVIQMSDGRLFGKLIDGKYGKHGLTVVVLIEAGIVKYVWRIFKNERWILENQFIFAWWASWCYIPFKP